MIELKSVSREETLRYLGAGKITPDEKTERLLQICEEKLVTAVSAKYLYKEIDLNNSPLIVGNSVKEHLKGCESAVLMCVTLGAEVDRLIRTASVTDMAEAVVLDAMAGAAVEQVCDEAEKIIAEAYSEKHLTWRFSPGYGDYPLSLQSEYLRILDAPRKIGLCSNESFLLTPAKSVTAIIGLSANPVENKRRGCVSCNLNKSCKFRKEGKRCEI